MDILLAGSFDAAEEDQWRQLLGEALAGHRLLQSPDAAQRAGIEVAVVANPPPGSLQGLPRLRLIQSLWAGVDRLLGDPTLPRDVPVSLHRRFFDYARQQREGRWHALAQRRADEVAVAVLGLGQIGSAVARRLAANGYAVSGWSARQAHIDGLRCLHGEATLPALLGEVDIVVNLLPLTDATRGLFNTQRFARMRRGATLVNLARGAHVVEADLLAALDAGHIGHAVLDVFAQEPLAADHAFWRHARVTVLPHVAALTDARSAARLAAQNIEALRDGRPLQHLVDRSRGY
ncbi:MAG: glyoxylate/hydroxypyruvate reductase A [Betaproteobacteria bacterium]|nr:MAG: glyoxylate/hydroxypyruvate reductase A [Betaproteobacteria bacterium]